MSPWDAPSESGDTFGLLGAAPPVRVGRAGGPRAHVLVCAPSNSALDEIVARLLQSGLLDWCALHHLAPAPTCAGTSAMSRVGSCRTPCSLWGSDLLHHDGWSCSCYRSP